MCPVRSATAPAARPPARAAWLGSNPVPILGSILGLTLALGPGCTRSETTRPPAEDAAPLASTSTSTNDELEPEPVETTDTVIPEPRPGPRVHVERTTDATFVYVELTLHSADLVTSGPSMERDLAHAFSDGGQFEIYLRPALLPVQAPECRDGLIVRMPWTDPQLEEAATAEERKRDLFSRLMQLVEGQRPSVRVVLELDPYVTVSDDEPPAITLDRCTLFFRYDPETFAYIDQLPDAPK